MRGTEGNLSPQSGWGTQGLGVGDGVRCARSNGREERAVEAPGALPKPRVLNVGVGVGVGVFPKAVWAATPRRARGEDPPNMRSGRGIG